MLQGYGTNFRSPKVDVHDFAMIPRADIPRSSFRMQFQHKTTFSASSLIPICCLEVLPGDTFACSMSAFVRMATPIYPIMDNLDLETWFFFVPNRLVWVNWYKFMGEQENPSDSISFSIPQVVSPVNGFAVNSIFDYFGLPCAGQIGVGNQISVSALPFRAYNIIYNQWFRDENLNNAATYGSTSGTGIAAMDNGPDPIAQYGVQNIMKRHDYFTSCLPWTQKGGTAITLPLGTQAPVKGLGWQTPFPNAFNSASTRFSDGSTSTPTWQTTASQATVPLSITSTTNVQGTAFPAIFADLSQATASTINAIRLAFQTQKLLERDARGGTRYTEIIRSHFGVLSPDMRLQRPEYLGGGKTPVNIAPVPQTTATGLTGGTSPLGTLSAVGTSVAKGHGFRQSFTEHGHILGFCGVRSDMIYQQGIRRMWKRLTRYDYYFPVFAALGEKAVLNSEIFADGSANDALVFGYQENWAEMRYLPSYTSAFFKSTSPTPLDAWHLAQKFASLPTLNAGFIVDSTSNQVQRAQAIGAGGANQQFLADFFFDVKAARPLPMYSVPGYIDHF